MSGGFFSCFRSIGKWELSRINRTLEQLEQLIAANNAEVQRNDIHMVKLGQLNEQLLEEADKARHVASKIREFTGK